MKKIRILAVGDVFIDREKPNTAFKYTSSLFENSDVIFGNCEGVYATQWERAPSSGAPLVADPVGIKVLANANFNLMSLANNHAVDGGYNALLSTLSGLEKSGIKVSGAGKNFEDAHKPAVIACGDKRVALLSYTSVFPHGYEARKGVPGLAVLRADTIYTPWEQNEWGPGLSPKVTTIPHEQDHNIFQDDIKKAKEIADVVLVSVHWGDFTQPYVLTDHERRAARMAIDAGADVILGHHHHMIRGIEFYKGKPIFYGLGHFAFDLPNLQKRLLAEGYLIGDNSVEERLLRRRFGEYRIFPREGYPLLPFHPDARFTFIASLDFDNISEQRVLLIPCLIDKDNVPKPFQSLDSMAKKVLQYLKKNCEYEGLSTEISMFYDKDDFVVKFKVKEVVLSRSKL